jgi:hypothetical protein
MEGRSAQRPVVSLTRDGRLKTQLKQVRLPFHQGLKTFEIAGSESEKILDFAGEHTRLRWAIRLDLRLDHGLQPPLEFFSSRKQVLLDCTDRELEELFNLLLGIIAEIEKGNDLLLDRRQLSNGLVDFTPIF